MDKNICRIFTFYSNFLPADNNRRNWKYCAFGTIDGIDVGKNIAKNNGEILNCIWKEHSEFQKNLPGTYNAERIYGVRFGDTGAEKEFWREKPEYPFLFFVRVQCEGDTIAFLDQGNRFNLEKKLSMDGKLMIMTYLTYGNSDLFLVIKSRNYKDGAQVIHTMNQGMNLILNPTSVCYLKNSFSIMAVEHDWIDAMKDLPQRTELNKNTIECVYIKIIKEPNQDIEELREEINTRCKGAEVKIRSVLGVDDEQIIIKNVGWGDFLSLYSKETGGMFCNSNEEFRDICAGSTTVIQEEFSDLIEEFQDKGIYFYKDSPESRQGFDDAYEKTKELKEKYLLQKTVLMDKLKEVQKSSSDKTFKEINIILNSVPRYAGRLFNDYIFFSILSPLNFLLSLMRENLKVGTLNMRDYYDFLKAFCMYVQGSLASDRHSIQAIDFNSKIYEVPVKLIAFYSTHISFVKRILSAFDKEEGDVCEYEFLVAPGISNVVYVDELFCWVSNKKRLMKVEIPEYCLYNLHDMMIILTHETAHYVGRVYRLRDDIRYNSIIKCFSHIYVSYVKSWCMEKNECQQVDDSVWKIVEQRMEYMLRRALERKLDKDYVSHVEIRDNECNYASVLEKNEIYGKHMSQLQVNIQMAMIDIVQYCLKNVFGPVLQENSEDFYLCIEEASERYIIVQSQSTLMSSKTAMEMLSMVYEEGFADLMAILVLEINAVEYVDSLLKDAKRQNWDLKKCYSSDLLYRVGIVLNCCISDRKRNESFFENFMANTDKQTDAEEFMKRALLTIANNKRQSDVPKLYYKELRNILRDNYVIDEVCHYLMCCVKKFHVDYEKPSEDMKTLRAIFKNYSSTRTDSTEDISAEKQIAELMKIIGKSRDYMLT